MEGETKIMAIEIYSERERERDFLGKTMLANFGSEFEVGNTGGLTSGSTAEEAKPGDGGYGIGERISCSIVRERVSCLVKSWS